MNTNSKSTLALGLLAALAMTAGATAQITPWSGVKPKATIPSDHFPDIGNKRLVNGASNISWSPFSNGVSRHMMIYDSLDIRETNSSGRHMAAGSTIKALGFQVEPGRNSVGHKIKLQVDMGKTTRTSQNAFSEFNKNYDVANSRTTVISTLTVDLPDLGKTIRLNKLNRNTPFLFIPLSSSYFFKAAKDVTGQFTENLIVDYMVSANANSNKTWTYYLDQARFVSPVRKLGDGCRTSSNQLPVLKSRPTALGSTYFITLTNAPASSPAMLVVGLAKLAVPVFVNPSCKTYIAPVVFLPPVQTSTGGRATWSFPTPNDPRLNDFNLFLQAAIPDAFSAHGFVVSSGDNIEFGMNPRLTTIWKTGSITAKTGSIWRGNGPISHFSY